MHTLAIHQVIKRYGHDVVVDDLSFTARPGRVTGFLGPNGAGKSTTMNVLLDLASADHGHALIGATRYRALADPARTVGVVLEPNGSHPGRGGRNHLRVLADGAGIPAAGIDELLDLVRYGLGQRVAFEIDHVDYAYHRGWSVMVRGTTAVVDDPAEVARIRAVWEPKPWAGGDRSVLLKLPWTELTERRLGSG